MSLSRIRSASIGCLALILVLAIAPVFTAGPKFYPDDPLQREPESRDASGAKSSDIGLIYEIAMNLFAVPHLKPTPIPWTKFLTPAGLPIASAACPFVPRISRAVPMSIARLHPSDG